MDSKVGGACSVQERRAIVSKFWAENLKARHDIRDSHGNDYEA